MNRSLLITGATGNLGRRIVPSLAAGQPSVALYRDDEAWKRLRDASPSSLQGIRCDLTDAHAIDHVFSELRPSHVLHLAGAWSGGSISETTDEKWMHAFEANLHPAFRVLRAFLQYGSRGGSAVFISSVGAAELRPGMAAYVVSKSALETLTKLGSREAAPLGLRVNAIAPDTIGDAAGEVSAERVLAAARELIHDDSCTGTVRTLSA